MRATLDSSSTPAVPKRISTQVKHMLERKGWTVLRTMRDVYVPAFVRVIVPTLQADVMGKLPGEHKRELAHGFMMAGTIPGKTWIYVLPETLLGNEYLIPRNNSENRGAL